MRRFPVLLVVVAVMVLGIGALHAQPTVMAQEASPAASPAALPALLQQWIEAVTAGDGSAVAALYAEDGVHEDVPSGTVVQGREQIAVLVDESARQLRDVRYDVVAAHQYEDLQILEYHFFATNRDNGQPLDVRGIQVFELAGDQIRRSAVYYDLSGTLGQLNVLDQSEGAAEATPAG